MLFRPVYSFQVSDAVIVIERDHRYIRYDQANTCHYQQYFRTPRIEVHD